MEGKGGEEERGRKENRTTQQHKQTRPRADETDTGCCCGFLVNNNASDRFLPSFRPLSAEVSGKEEYKSVCR
jgi:hypothetical protein